MLEIVRRARRRILAVPQRLCSPNFARGAMVRLVG